MKYKIEYSVEILDDNDNHVYGFGYDSGESALNFKDATIKLSAALLRMVTEPEISMSDEKNIN